MKKSNKSVAKSCNTSVVKSWSMNKAASSYNGNLSTDGKYLFSYNLVIGRTMPNGDKVALLYNAPNGYFESMTTSTHVGYAVAESNSKEVPYGDKLTKRAITLLGD